MTDTGLKTFKDRFIDNVIGIILRTGVYIAVIVCIIGGSSYIAQHGQEKQPDFSVFKAEPLQYRSLSGVINGVKNFESVSIMQLGVLLLIATPLMRVLFSFFAFLAEKDYMYVFITLLVIGIILFSMFSKLAV